MPTEGGIVDGIPVGPLETAGLLLVAWIAAHRGRIAGGWAAGAVLVAAAVASAAVPGDRGFTARYYASATATGQHERSTEYRDAAFTRVDKQLEFTRNERDFPLAFFNDHARFNYLRPGEPDRRHLEFSVAWTAWLHVPGNGTRTFYLHAPGSPAEVSIDTTPILTSTAGTDAGLATEIDLAEGWHRVHVTFSSPYEGPREFSAGELVAGVHAPFDTSDARTERPDKRQMILSKLFGFVKDAADILALAWLATLAGLIVLRRIGEIWQRHIPVYRPAIALFVAAGAIEALRFAWPWATRLRIMIAGDDTMTYEGYARDILFNGLLMNGGAPAGQGEPFYYQALYPYFLAFTHLVFGDSVFGALFLQRLLVVLTAVMLTRLAMAFRGDDVWPFALATSALFTWWKCGPIASDMLNESLYIPLLVAWTLVLVRSCGEASPSRAAAAGTLAGLAALTRSTLTLSWLIVWPVMAVQWWKPRRTALLTMIACSVAVYALLGVRNVIVSGQFVVSPTGGGITLLGGNQPPPGLTIDAGRLAVYNRIGLGGYTIEVLEYAFAEPGMFAANLGRKALFALGFYEPYAEGWGYSPVYIAAWLSALAGLVVLLRSGAPRIPLLMPLLIAVTQFAAVVIVYPKGERLILPIHTLLMPYSAVAAMSLWQRAAGLPPPRRRSTPNSEEP